MLDNYVKRSMYGAAESGAVTDRYNITSRSTYFGLADLGFGCPELGSFALEELELIQLPFRLGIERDIHFEGRFPLSVYAEAASRAGSLVEGERILHRGATDTDGEE